jgi:hypothetical protein
VDKFKEMAVALVREVGVNRHSLRAQIPEWQNDQPLAVQERIGAAVSVLPPAIGVSHHAPAVGGDDQAVLEILRGLQVNKEYLRTQGPGVPTAVGRALNDVLPKQGLLPFLQTFPQYFEVTLTGEMNSKKKPRYTFKMLPAINEVTATAEPAVGGSGGGAGAASSSLSSPLEPAVGGSGGGAGAANSRRSPPRSQMYQDWLMIGDPSSSQRVDLSSTDE